MENESTRQTPWSAVGILLLAASITVGCNTDSTKESAPILETLEDVASVKTYNYTGEETISISFHRNTDLTAVTNLLPELVQIENLRGLHFHGDIIDNYGVTLIAPLTDLTSLSFSQNKLITDECLNNLKGYKYLQHLNLGQTNIGDDGLEFLSHLEEFQNIDLHLTKVTDDGLEHLKKLSKLKVLKLQQTTVTTWGHDNLKAFLPKCDIRYSPSRSNQPPTERTDYDLLQIRNEVNSSGTISDEQAESLSKLKELTLPILKSITDTQAESLSRVERLLLGLTVITDEQAESLSRVKELVLPNLKSITDAQAESLSNVQTLKISDSCQELVDKYKKP